jgi:hypothetical protein
MRDAEAKAPVTSVEVMKEHSKRFVKLVPAACIDHLSTSACLNDSALHFWSCTVVFSLDEVIRRITISLLGVLLQG